MMTIILVLVYIAVFLLMAQLFSKREGYYSTIVVFGLAAYIYYIGIPFEMALLNLDSVERGSIKLTLTGKQLSQIVGMGIIAFVSFSTGYYLSKFNPFKDSSTQSKISSREPIQYSVIFLWITSLVIISIFFHNIIIAVSSYKGAVELTYGNPLYSLLVTYAVISTALIIAVTIGRGKIKDFVVGAGLIFLIILWGIYSSDKSLILIGILTLGAIFIKSKLNKKFVSLLLIILAVFGGILSFTVFNIYIRGDGRMSINEGGGIIPINTFFKKHFSLRYFDPLGPALSIEHVLNNTNDFKSGITYTNSLSLFIPRVLWRDRPLDLSEQFARETIPNWSRGQGCGFSLLAEAYLNFSWWGAFIQYFFIGLLWGFFWKTLRKVFFRHYSTSLWQSFYIIVSYYLLIIMHRGPVIGVFKSLIMYSALFVLFTVLFDFSMIKNQ